MKTHRITIVQSELIDWLLNRISKVEKKIINASVIIPNYFFIRRGHASDERLVAKCIVYQQFWNKYKILFPFIFIYHSLFYKNKNIGNIFQYIAEQKSHVRINQAYARKVIKKYFNR